MTFPNQIIDVIAAEVATIANVDQAVKRDLKLDDPNCIVAVTGGKWQPEAADVGKQTMGAARAPAISSYEIQVALFIKGLGEEDMYALRNEITREIRDLVETDSNLRNTLIGLEETGSPANPETVRFMKIKNQQPGQIVVEDTGDFAYFSLTELIIEVES